MVQEDKTVRLLTEFQNELLRPGSRVFTEIQNQDLDSNVTPPDSNVTSFNNSSIGGNVVREQKERKFCKVTGLDISMQKKGSRFLSIKGVRFLYKNDRQKYDALLSKLPSKWHNAPLEVQEYKIAHYVRDKFFNPRNSTRRAIKRMCSEPVLFDNRPLISKKKLKIANTQ